MASYMDTINRVLSGDFTQATPEERTEAVENIVQVCSVAAGAVTIQPIPLVDVALVVPIQISMVQAVARIYGHSLDKKSIVEILSTFGASLVAQNVIMAASKLIPFLGWLVAPSMAYALTYAVGEVSNYYFAHGRGVSQSDLREMFQRIYKAKHQEKKQQHKDNTTLKQRLEQLKEAYKSGLLTEEEFNRKKEDVLKDF
ncbi:MAG: DUF697 domain-containing protein [Myxococcota bacterium]